MTTVSDIADIPDVIQAKVFQLVDDNGDVRAELKTDVNGERSFTLMDQQGQPRLIAGLDGGNSFLQTVGVDLHLTSGSLLNLWTTLS